MTHQRKSVKGQSSQLEEEEINTIMITLQDQELIMETQTM